MLVQRGRGLVDAQGSKLSRPAATVRLLSLPLLLSTAQELQDVTAGKAFGATLDLEVARQALTPETLIPGVAVYR